jgi:hypothetical protein
MKPWVRRLRGAVGMGLTWAVGWAIFGLFIGVGMRFVGLPMGWFVAVFDSPLPALGVPGFFSGAVFSLVLGVAARRRRFDQLSLPLFAGLGALGGLLLSLIPAGALAVQQPGVLAVISGTLTVLSAGSATGTLLLARMAEGDSSRAGRLSPPGG